LTELFEMRRLEALSNTIFGVAMTLLAYNFPKEPFLNGAPPTWSAIFVAYQSQVIALVLSFVVSGMYWIAHQRRLAYEPHATRSTVYLNLLFCCRSSPCRSRLAFTARMEARATSSCFIPATWP
jgi:uncharacterized membrane protein